MDLRLSFKSGGSRPRSCTDSTDDTAHEHDRREPDDTGIGDRDGLLEQVGGGDWQHTVMA